MMNFPPHGKVWVKDKFIFVDLGEIKYAISLDQRLGEQCLIGLWKDPNVPKCIKMAVERLHSQHRRMISKAI